MRELCGFKGSSHYRGPQLLLLLLLLFYIANSCLQTSVFVVGLAGHPAYKKSHLVSFQSFLLRASLTSG